MQLLTLTDADPYVESNFQLNCILKMRKTVKKRPRPTKNKAERNRSGFRTHSRNGERQQGKMYTNWMLWQRQRSFIRTFQWNRTDSEQTSWRIDQIRLIIFFSEFTDFSLHRFACSIQCESWHEMISEKSETKAPDNSLVLNLLSF